MIKSLLRVLIGFFVVFFVLVISFHYYQRNKHEKEEVLKAFDEMLYITENWKVIDQEIQKERMVETLVDFMNGKSIDYVKEKQNKISYTLEDLGFKNPTRCNLIFDIGKYSEITCQFKNRILVSGDLKFFKIENKPWGCLYTGNQDNSPKLCLEEKNKEITKKS